MNSDYNKIIDGKITSVQRTIDYIKEYHEDDEKELIAKWEHKLQVLKEAREMFDID
jgi:uncharacterized protein YlaN (UPF0358 family)